MPFKYRANTGRKPKQGSSKPKRDWSTYNQQMKRRGDITIWLSNDVMKAWTLGDRAYVGDGAPRLYSDMAITTVHEIRQVFRLPLRQCEGFVNALFTLLKVDLRCPSFSTLSKRLKILGLKRPYYRFTQNNTVQPKMIAIDSSGLKCYGQDEWVQEKYGETSEKRDWRKLHISVDQHNMIQTSQLTTRNVHDSSVVGELVKPLPHRVTHVTADTAYDANPLYALFDQTFPNVDIVIPPRRNAKDHNDNHWMRNRNLREIQCYGRLRWQQDRDYGKRNQAEIAIGRYKRILGNRLHSREFTRQQQEILIGCSILNKMTGMTTAPARQKF